MPMLALFGASDDPNISSMYKDLSKTNTSFSSNSGTNNSSSLGLGINLNNVSVSRSSETLLHANETTLELTAGDVCVPLKDVYYITDTIVINKDLAHRLIKSELAGSFIMVRASKEVVYESSEQMEIG
jgi:hypothetical protein